MRAIVLKYKSRGDNFLDTINVLLRTEKDMSNFRDISKELLKTNPFKGLYLHSINHFMTYTFNDEDFFLIDMKGKETKIDIVYKRPNTTAVK